MARMTFDSAILPFSVPPVPTPREWERFYKAVREMVGRHTPTCLREMDRAALVLVQYPDTRFSGAHPAVDPRIESWDILCRIAADPITVKVRAHLAGPDLVAAFDLLKETIRRAQQLALRRSNRRRALGATAQDGTLFFPSSSPPWLPPGYHEGPTGQGQHETLKTNSPVFWPRVLRGFYRLYAPSGHGPMTPSAGTITDCSNSGPAQAARAVLAELLGQSPFYLKRHLTALRKQHRLPLSTVRLLQGVVSPPPLPSGPAGAPASCPTP